MPEQVFLALVSIALLWRMDHSALMIGAGFLGLLCPHAVRQLHYVDF